MRQLKHFNKDIYIYTIHIYISCICIQIYTSVITVCVHVELSRKDEGVNV